MSKSNKWDAAGDVLRVMKRMETLSEHQRTPREYNKRKSVYWDSELNERRAKQKCQLQQSCEDASSSQVDVADTMSADELREGLKRFGIQTRVRKLTRLQEMYRQALKNQ